jgi:ABC-type sugar transport system ATPase subunit
MADVTSAQLVNWMVGRVVSELYPQRRQRPGEVRLRVEHLSRWGFFHDVSFTVRGGEILGLGGLSGAGRSELARSMCGIDPIDDGDIFLDDQPATAVNYGRAIARGFAYLTEDRKTQGLALRLDVGETMLAGVLGRLSAGGFYWPGRGSAIVRDMIDKLQINPPDCAATAGNLSGGNQQKVLLSKWLATQPQVLILDEPTRGVDVGAKVAIHLAVAEAADRGIAVILISSDLPELVGLAHRIVILRKGHLIGQLPDDQRSEDAVLLAANGEGELQPV